MFQSITFRFTNRSILVSTAILIFSVLFVAEANAQAGVGSFGGRPFVTGFTPVIGRNGAVGGIDIDAAGVVQRADIKHQHELRNRWRDLTAIETGIDSRTADATDMRIVSLSRLDRAVQKRLDAGEPLTPDMLFLAGMQRVEYVLADPDSYDVLIAGPAGPWKANEAGDVVMCGKRRASTETGRSCDGTSQCVNVHRWCHHMLDRTDRGRSATLRQSSCSTAYIQ